MNLNIELKKLTDKISYADIFKFSTVKKLTKSPISNLFSITITTAHILALF